MAVPDVPAMTHLSVNEMIAATPLGPILDRPVVDVLAGLGLPPLPTPPPMPPLPGLPPLPPIDLHMLIKPMTDLLGGFGSGDLSAAPFDPSAIFEGLSKVLESTIGMGSGALKAIDQLWVGQSATAAAGKTAQAGADTAAVSTQGTGMSFDISAAAGIVGAGLAALQAIIGATIAKMTATIAAMVTPAGPPMMLGFASEGLAEATASVAATRAQLLGPTAHMTFNGAPVSITNAPAAAAGAAQSPFGIASTIVDGVSPVVSSVSELPSMIASPVSQMLSVNPRTDLTRYAGEVTGRGGGPGGSGPGGGGAKHAAGGGAGGGAAGMAGIGGMSSALGSRPMMSGMPGGIEPAGGAPAQNQRATVTTASPMPASMAPMGAAGTGRGAGASEEQHEVPDYLVTEDNGQQVVGQTPDVVPAVLGHDEPEPGPRTPDIELRLGPDPASTGTK